MFSNDANNFLVDPLNQTIPDHNFLFPEFEIVTEAEDEIIPEAVEMEDYSDVTESMGKDMVYTFCSTMTKYTLGKPLEGGEPPSVCHGGRLQMKTNCRIYDSPL